MKTHYWKAKASKINEAWDKADKWMDDSRIGDLYDIVIQHQMKTALAEYILNQEELTGY